MKAILIVLSGTVIVLFVAALHPMPDVPPIKPAASWATDAPQPHHTDYCGITYKDEIAAGKAYKASEYRTAKTIADKGLAAASSCMNDDAVMVRKGYLLSIRAFAEHNLPDGDARTDFNQANQLLVECQTRLYGTKTAAECESQEQNNIHAQTTWDVDG